ncbi:tetraspanin-1 [Corythoichthys intestinalis]|uniref:tetraspanin-1 n=1 Tax=Corythoichthys intestinalis TaxID=161448 RepID=UPI0025A58116|nr:tetraspanin-1 [Corythoichthys intestinalis]
MCHFKFAKVMMVLSNLLILSGGLTLLAMGIWASVDGTSYLKILAPFSSQGMQHVNVRYFCIAIGTLLVLLGLLGSFGMHKESKCLLLTFFCIIFIIFIAEVAAAVVTLAYSSFGCFEYILKTLKEHANIVGGIAGGVCILEMSALISSMYLYCCMDNRGR